MCGRGNYCPANSTEPTPCPVGTYGASPYAWSDAYCYPCYGSYSNQTGSERCTHCGKGNYCPRGSINPTPCPAGSYSSSISSTRCYTCSAGRYSDEEGAAACKTCPEGHYCSSNSTEPIPCPTGSYSRSYASRCYPCQAGTYNDETASAECKSCPAGHYCGSNSTEPTPCPEGTTSPPRSSYEGYCRPIRPVPGNCTAGMFKNDIEECERCPTGHYCPEGATEPTPCPTGTFGPWQMSRSEDRCLECNRGTYNDEEGASRCTQCGPGNYCESGSDSPVPCPKGTYSSYSNAWSEDLCRECYAGYYGDEEGLARCKPCPEGSYCEAGTVEPTSCPDGHTSPPYSRSKDQCRPEA